MIETGNDIKNLRADLGMSLKTFWAKLGFGEKDGARFEKAATAPDGIKALIGVATDSFPYKHVQQLRLRFVSAVIEEPTEVANTAGGDDESQV